MPAISVLFPVYNAVGDLPRSLSSLLNQTFRDFEVIAIDDGSTDGSGELLEKYARQDERLRVFHQPNAGALGKVLNRAAELAQGKYLARQDADDASHASRFENQIAFLEKNQDIGLCGTWSWCIDAELGPLFSLEIPDKHELLCSYLYKGMNPFVHGSIMMPGKLFNKLGGYRGSYAEDYDLWVRTSEKTRLGMCTSLGYYYWRSVGGISTGANFRQQMLIQLTLKLHSERIKIGSEVTSWSDEYSKVSAQAKAESNLAERQTAVHYARSVQLIRRHRYSLARNELEKAAAGQGSYSLKARRNLSYFWLAPVLAMLYIFSRWKEPEHYSRTLPENTPIPF